MLRFIYVIIANLFRAPWIIPKMRRMASHPDRYTISERYALAQQMIRYMSASGRISTEVYGIENLPNKGGYIMFPNHQGKYDALGIISTHPSSCTFVMDKMKSRRFLINELVRLLYAKRLKIRDPRDGLKVMNQIAQEVRNGARYILFSEGGYHHNHNHVCEFHPGSFKCALWAKAPIVPVALIDSYKVFNSLHFGPITTKVIYLKPIMYQEYKHMKTPQIARMVRGRIIAAMAEHGVDGSAQR